MSLSAAVSALLVFLSLTAGPSEARRLLNVGEIKPAPASIGAAVPLTYFGPAPSSVQKELVGPYQLLKSGTIDFDQGTITLPLYRGSLKQAHGSNNSYIVWYVITDTDDASNAAALGINPSSKLTYANTRGAARQAKLDQDLTLVFESGTVDFSPVRMLVPGDAPDFFPPKSYNPGSLGDVNYSPLVVVQNAGGHVYNAPIIAGNVAPDVLGQYCNGIRSKKTAEARAILHDKVTAICPSDTGFGGTVTLQLTQGFSFGKPVLYLSLDSSDALPATIEEVTSAPGLKRVAVGGDDSAFSGVERIFAFTNGYTNGDLNPERRNDAPANETQHPGRQGFDSALRGDGGPLNVLGGIPTVATDYSPLWDLNIAEWTPYAVASKYRQRCLDEFTILGLVQRGYLTGPGGKTFGSTGFINNCPIVHRFL